jgi:hypothetical protein
MRGACPHVKESSQDEVYATITAETVNPEGVYMTVSSNCGGKVDQELSPQYANIRLFSGQGNN